MVFVSGSCLKLENDLFFLYIFSVKGTGFYIIRFSPHPTEWGEITVFIKKIASMLSSALGIGVSSGHNYWIPTKMNID